MLKAVIIDDEQYCIDSLSAKLEAFPDKITLVGSTTQAGAAIALVQSHQPDVIFVDINLGTTTGFELLEKLPQPWPGIIFCTAYDHYAIKAFRYNALDYLLKPVEQHELGEAITKAAVVTKPSLQLDQLQLAISMLQRKSIGLQKIALPSVNGFELIELPELVRLEAASNYTHFYINNGRKITVSKTLKEYENLLEEEGFARIHQSHVINLKYLKSFNRGKTASVIMQDGIELDISATRRDKFMELFRDYFKAG